MTPEEKSTSKDPQIINGMYEGLPYKGTRLNLKNKDSESRKPRLENEAHAQTFDMSDPKDLKEFEVVWTQITRGFCAVGFEEKIYDPETKNWRICMRWTEQFFTNQPQKHKR